MEQWPIEIQLRTVIVYLDITIKKFYQCPEKYASCDSETVGGSCKGTNRKPLIDDCVC